MCYLVAFRVALMYIRFYCIAVGCTFFFGITGGTYMSKPIQPIGYSMHTSVGCILSLSNRSLLLETQHRMWWLNDVFLVGVIEKSCPKNYRSCSFGLPCNGFFFGQGPGPHGYSRIPKVFFLRPCMCKTCQACGISDGFLRSTNTQVHTALRPLIHWGAWSDTPARPQHGKETYKNTPAVVTGYPRLWGTLPGLHHLRRTLSLKQLKAALGRTGYTHPTRLFFSLGTMMWHECISNILVDSDWHCVDISRISNNDQVQLVKKTKDKHGRTRVVSCRLEGVVSSKGSWDYGLIVIA